MCPQACLFSSALICFIVDSKQNSKVSPADQMVYYHQQSVVFLDQISRQLVSIAPDIPILSTPLLPHPSFKPLPPDVHINVFWIMALLFSLLATLLATLVRQWVCDYMNNFQRYSKYPLKSRRPRRHLPEGSEELHLLVIAGAVLRLLHVSLILFLLGICDFALDINTTVDLNKGVPIAISGLLYIFPTSGPFKSPQSPCQCTLSGLIRYLFKKFAYRQFTDRGFNGASRPVSSNMAQGQMKPTVEEMEVRWLLDCLALTDVSTPPSHESPTMLRPVENPVIFKNMPPPVPSTNPWPDPVQQVVLEEIWDRTAPVSGVAGQVSLHPVDGVSFKDWDNIIGDPKVEPEPLRFPVVNPTPVPLAPSGHDWDGVVQLDGMDNIADAPDASGLPEQRTLTGDVRITTKPFVLVQALSVPGPHDYALTTFGFALNGMATSMVDETIDLTRMSLDANSQTVLAGPLLAKSKALSSKHQNDAASIISTEAVTILRSMSVARPVFSPFLAHALDTHAHHLSEANRKEESYSVRRDAVEHWQTLIATVGGAVARPLAGSLFELAKFRRKGADRQSLREEFRIAESAVEMFREAEPLDASGLGDALYLYADRMLELDRIQEARTYAEESVLCFRKAASKDPKYALDLIFSLSLASACLACTERDDAALEYAKQAIEFQRGRRGVGDPQYDSQLRKLLMDVVFRAVETDKPDDAAPWYEELQSLGGSGGTHRFSLLISDFDDLMRTHRSSRAAER